MSVEGPRRSGDPSNSKEPIDDPEIAGFSSIIGRVLPILGDLLESSRHGSVDHPLKREESFIDLERGEGGIPTKDAADLKERANSTSQTVLGRSHAVSDASSQSLTPPQRDGSQAAFGAGSAPIQISHDELQERLHVEIDNWGFLGGFTLMEELSKEGRISREQANQGYLLIGLAATESKTNTVEHYYSQTKKEVEVKPADAIAANKALRLIDDDTLQKAMLLRVMREKKIPVYKDEPVDIEIPIKKRRPPIGELRYPSESRLTTEITKKGFEGGFALVQNWFEHGNIDSKQANEYYFFIGRMACNQNNEYQAQQAFRSMPKCETRDSFGKYIEAVHPEWFDRSVASRPDQFSRMGKGDPFQKETRSFTSIIDEYQKLTSPPKFDKIENDLLDVLKTGGLEKYDHAKSMIHFMSLIPKFPEAHLNRAYLIVALSAIEEGKKDIAVGIISLMSDDVDKDQLIALVKGGGWIPEL